MNAHDPSRRRFLGKAALIAMAALGTEAVARQAASPAAKPATAATLPRLTPDNALAKALAYTDNAATVKHALFKPGTSCANCNFYKGAKGEPSGPCPMFPQNTVSAKGWCTAWAKKA
ncbi:high-potential iron-sulfur protein [Lysobacter sp. FW306-1B-D06B]|uniref:high-potential iron-sulfur protein n=1 Tax=Lysobacter sp. FW306-1B-D06B TaxID=3140250 RepID=UPI0031404665